MSEETKKTPGAISRREFLRDAGIVAGGTAIGSTILLSACSGGSTETKTSMVTKTITETIKESKFVCPVDGMEFDTFAALQDHFEATHPEAPTPVTNMISLTINGRKRELFVAANCTLHDVIHNQLRLIGAKTFCKRGACGSCTVVMDGRPVLSCMILAIECDGKNIETSEGIAAAKHPLIDAYVKHECAQCGYCTPGFVVTAKALLDRNPNPTEEEAKEALAGNLCRCGTYPQHSIAVLEAAKVLRGGV